MKQLYTTCSLVLLLVCLKAQNISYQLDRYLCRPGTFNGTALVVYKGDILLYKGYGYKNSTAHTLNDTTTIFRIGSLSKPFTATVIMRLEQEGRLHVQDPISRYIPGYPAGDSITIEQLLTHHSGIKEYLAVPAIQQLPDQSPPISMEKLIATFKDEPRYLKPGEQLAYSNSNYILLAYIIEKITGEKFEHVVWSMIFDPLQMAHSGFDFAGLTTPDKSTGHAREKSNLVTKTDFDSTYAPGCGSMFTTAMDLYKFYKGLYTGQVISAATRERAFVPRQWWYGYGWFSYAAYGKKCISHAGGVPGFVADMKFYPDDDLCIILLQNSTTGKADPDKIAAIVFGKRFKRSGV
jgi:CubicO group peptidase (beta-lactamase class C family)